jgi:hypothetical protein
MRARAHARTRALVRAEPARARAWGAEEPSAPNAKVTSDPNKRAHPGPAPLLVAGREGEGSAVLEGKAEPQDRRLVLVLVLVLVLRR